MTVGLFISPSGNSALLSDTMGYVSGADNHSGLPARYSPHLEEGSIKRLFRKSFIVDDNTVFAVAGEIGAIRDFVTNFRLLHKYFGAKAAADRIQVSANDYPSVQAIIVFSESFGKDAKSKIWGINLPDRHRSKHSLMGDIWAIGSGAERAVNLATSYGKQAESFDPLSKRPFELISSFNHSLSGGKLRNELLFDEEDDWGGFLEYVYFDLQTGKWLRGPKCLYLYYYVVLLPERKYTCHLIGHAFAYEPGNDHGGIMVKESAKAGAAGFEVLIEDVFSPVPASSFGPDLWYKWKPDVANISFIVTEDKAGFKTCNITTVENEIHDVVFEIDAEKTSYGVRDRLADYYSNKAYRYTGWEYIPARNLPNAGTFVRP